jgi:hypothetical protein
VVSAFYTVHRKALEDSIWDIKITKKMAPVAREKLEYLDNGMAAWVNKDKEVQVRMLHYVDTKGKIGAAYARMEEIQRTRDVHSKADEARYRDAEAHMHHLNGIAEFLMTGVREIGYKTRLFTAINATERIPVAPTQVQKPAQPCEENTSAQTISGVWETNWGDVTLQQNSANVTGHYVHDNGKIQGQLSTDGKTLTANWSEAPSYQPPNDAGKTVLTFSSDLKSFSGPWGYGATLNNGTWTSKKKRTNPACTKPENKSAEPPPCEIQNVPRSDVPDFGARVIEMREKLRQLNTPEGAAQ